MAPSLSSSSQAKYDVFLSFRGEDTRRTFTSHLYAALCQKNISTFMDDEEIRRGNELSPILMDAIEESKISIIIFSKNYASSTWCLNELVQIIKCKNTKQQIIIPIFYNIDPSHVRKQSGPYKDIFTEHEKHNQDKLQEWRMALREAANLAGWDSSNIRLDSVLVQCIVEDVLQKLAHIIDPQLPSGLVGIKKSIGYVEPLLCIESTDVRSIGLWGMGGIGKTTIAEVLFQKFSSQFEGCCFIENVREEWKSQGKNGIRNKLRTQVLGDHKLYSSNYTRSLAYVENRLQRRKVLVVLDDVSDSQQIEYLVGDKNGYGPGSRIIITTRDKDVLKTGIDGLYEVMPLSDEEAFQLFSLKAFQQDHPTSEFIHLSKMVVNYAKGIPLVLEILGSLLYSKSQREWESTLHKLKKVPNAEIHRVLRLSYEELDYEEQSIFLDIACCWKGWSKYNIKSLLDGCGFSTDIGMKSLENKSLITISVSNTVSMHDLIQEMAWQVVREESIKEPEKRSRLWDPEDIYLVFKHKAGTDNSIESIMLNMSEIKVVEINPTTFSTMHKLRFLNFFVPPDDRRPLKLHTSIEDRRTTKSYSSTDDSRPNMGNLRISKGLEALPNQLRFLRWDCFPLKVLPSSFCAEVLVELHLHYSLVEKLWDGEQDLANLKSLGLRGSKRLIELPNLSRANNLEVIDLQNCSSLQHVPSSIFSLDGLLILNLSGCKELQCIQSDMNSKSLLKLSLGECSNLVQFSVTSDKLKYLDLHGTAIEELPSSLGQSKNLLCLDLYGCRRLKNLPNNFFHVRLDALVSFAEELPPIFYTSSSTLSSSFSLFSALNELNLSGTYIEMLPESIKFVSQLRKLNVAYCIKLRSLPEFPLSLQKLDANMCISLETVSGSTITALIKNSFGCQNKKVLLRQIQDEKISLLCVDYWEWLEFVNCTRLEENARKTIMDEAIIRIKYAAYLSSMVQPFIDPYHQFYLLSNIYGPETIENTFRHIWLWGFSSPTVVIKFNANCCSDCKRSRFAFGLYLSNKEKDTSLGLDGRHKICMQQQNSSCMQLFDKLWYKDVKASLPGLRVPSCFRYRTTDTNCRITIQLPSPSHLLGFAFCSILSSDLDLTSRIGGQTLISVNCELNLEDSTWHRSYQSNYLYPDIQMKLFSDTVFLWYDAKTSYEILEDVKEKRSTVQCSTYNPKLSFYFYGIHGIKECGVWPIYDSDLEPEKKKKKKTLKRKSKTNLILWHCKWQALIIRRMKKSKNHRLFKHRNRVQANISFTSRKKAIISNTCIIEEVHKITRQ